MIQLEILTKHNLRGAPVVDEEGNIKGIVTEGDLIRRVANLEGPSYLAILGSIIYLDTKKTMMEELEKAMGKTVEEI